MTPRYKLLYKLHKLSLSLSLIATPLTLIESHIILGVPNLDICWVLKRKQTIVYPERINLWTLSIPSVWSSAYVILCLPLFFAVPPGDAQPASASGRTEGVRCWAQDSRKGAGCWNFATDRQIYVFTFSPKYRSNKCMWMPSCLLEAIWNEYIKGGHSSNQPLWLLGPTPNSNDLPRSKRNFLVGFLCRVTCTMVG